MPRVKKHTARRNIYRIGVKVENPKTKSGYRRDRSKPADEKDELIVPVGAEYWTWQFKNGGRHYSLKPPTKRQLTQSEHQLQIYDFEDMIEALSGCETPEDLESGRDNIVSEVESYKSDLEDRLSNMPEALQESSVLNERIEALDTAIGELESIDLDFDCDEEGEDAIAEYTQNWLDEKIQEFNISFE